MSYGPKQEKELTTEKKPKKKRKVAAHENARLWKRKKPGESLEVFVATRMEVLDKMLALEILGQYGLSEANATEFYQEWRNDFVQKSKFDPGIDDKDATLMKF